MIFGPTSTIFGVASSSPASPGISFDLTKSASASTSGTGDCGDSETLSPTICASSASIRSPLEHKYISLSSLSPLSACHNIISASSTSVTKQMTGNSPPFTIIVASHRLRNVGTSTLMGMPNESGVLKYSISLSFTSFGVGLSSAFSLALSISSN